MSDELAKAEPLQLSRRGLFKAFGLFTAAVAIAKVIPITVVDSVKTSVACGRATLDLAA